MALAPHSQIAATNKMLLLLHYLLIVGISIAVLLISVILDTLCAPLSPAFQFVVQVPLLVFAVDTLRSWVLSQEWNLSESRINSSFFFAAPLAAVASRTLMGDIGRLIRA